MRSSGQGSECRESRDRQAHEHTAVCVCVREGGFFRPRQAASVALQGGRMTEVVRRRVWRRGSMAGDRGGGRSLPPATSGLSGTTRRANDRGGPAAGLAVVEVGASGGATDLSRR